MRLRREGKRPRLSPRPLQTVGCLVFSSRHGVVRDVGNARLEGGKLQAVPFVLLLESADLFLECLHLREPLGRRLPAHGRQFVAAAALFLQARDRVAAQAVELHEPVDPRAGEPLRHLFEKARRVLAQELA